MPLPPFPNKKYRPPPVRRTWLQEFAGNLWIQLLIVGGAMAARRMYDSYLSP